MAKTKLDQLVVYLESPLAEKAKAMAGRQGTTVSKLLRELIVSSVAPVRAGQDDVTTSLHRLHIAVDALVKYHPNDKLFGIVRATQREKCGSRSDEA